MEKIVAGSIILCLISLAGQAGAQPDPRKALDALQERGQQEMAPSWRTLGVTHKAAVFMHNDVRKAGPDQLAVWMHNELPVTEYLEKEKAYLSLRERMLVECKSGKLGISEQAYYAERFARGAVVGTNRVRNVDMQEVVPDSIEEMLVKIVCAPKPRKAPVRRTKAEAKAESKPAE